MRLEAKADEVRARAALWDDEDARGESDRRAALEAAAAAAAVAEKAAATAASAEAQAVAAEKALYEEERRAALFEARAKLHETAAAQREAADAKALVLQAQVAALAEQQERLAVQKALQSEVHTRAQKQSRVIAAGKQRMRRKQHQQQQQQEEEPHEVPRHGRSEGRGASGVSVAPLTAPLSPAAEQLVKEAAASANALERSRLRAKALLDENNAKPPPPGYPIGFFGRFEGAKEAVKVSKQALATLLPGEAGKEAKAKGMAQKLKASVKGAR